MDRLARIAVKEIRKRYENGYRGQGRETYSKMYKDIGALLVAFDAAQTTVEGLEKRVKATEVREARDEIDRLKRCMCEDCKARAILRS